MSWLQRFKSLSARISPGSFRRARTGYRSGLALYKSGLGKVASFLGQGTFRLGGARGVFSTYQDLIREGKESQIILASQEGVAVAEDSICALSNFTQYEEQKHPILWERYPNARLVSKALTLVNEKKEINLEAAYGEERYRADPAFSYVSLPEATYLPGRWTSLISRWVPSNSSTNFAHWFYDALPRLALLKHFPEDVGILIPGEVLRFHKQSLEMLGLLDRCRPTSETHLVLEEYYFSSPVSMIVCWCPYAYRYLEETFLPFRSDRQDLPKRFYIVRRGVTRGAVNEAEVAKYFESIGWALIDTASLSLADQIALFHHAEAYCGLHGAGFVNMQWSRPGTAVIEIFPSTFLSGCYELVALHQKLDYKSFIFPGDVFNETKVDIDTLDAYLKAKQLTR